tara:strand:+ start:203 stop:622 length:420 start_codon:yes stop_codon:yes gene_type:complete
MLDIEDIAKGNMDGEVVYICDYRQPDLSNKPIRKQPPTRALIVSNSETNKRIYYSESHFRPFGKNEKLLSKVIPLFDNTGYRSFTGNPLYVFKTHQECVDKWKELVDDIISRKEAYILQLQEQHDEDMIELNKIKKAYD